MEGNLTCGERKVEESVEWRKEDGGIWSGGIEGNLNMWRKEGEAA